MNRRLTVFLLALSVMIGLLGCRNDGPHDDSPAATTPTRYPTTDELSISIKDGSVSEDGLTLILNSTSSEYCFVYSEGAGVEKLVDGEWIDLYEGKDHEIALVAYAVQAGQSKEHEVCWKDPLGSLPSGEYRIALYVDKRPAEDNADAGSLGIYVLYAYFQL